MPEAQSDRLPVAAARGLAAPKVLTRDQVASYHANGYVAVERLIKQPLLKQLQDLAQEFIDRSRKVSASDDVFDVAPSHTAQAPKLRRLKTPDEQHPLFWETATGIIADVAADLIGPDVTFHHSKLNFKWADGTDQVRWHQDISFYPHTNYDLLTIGVYLHGAAADDGPLMVLPKSHLGPVCNQYDAKGAWTGSLSDADVAKLPLDQAVTITLPPGSVTVHNAVTLHASGNSKSKTGRPLLLFAYAPADAFPYTPNPSKSRHDRALVRGNPARWARMDPRPCLVPPDWSKGYTSIYAAQAGEDKSGMM
ncbi:MAG: phytanoyl-CoA dioxygenase family protein [Alphaproteobacteria bacterium]|nr:phytanoyl-CoA dioxygenase family protein [Alphaproteobacteria bacterium]